MKSIENCSVEQLRQRKSVGENYLQLLEHKFGGGGEFKYFAPESDEELNALNTRLGQASQNGDIPKTVVEVNRALYCITDQDGLVAFAAAVNLMRGNQPDERYKGGREALGMDGNALALDTSLVNKIVEALDRRPSKSVKGDGWSVSLSHGKLDISQSFSSEYRTDPGDFSETLNINLNQPNQGRYHFQGFDPRYSWVVSHRNTFENNQRESKDQSELANKFLERLVKALRCR